MKSYPIEDSNLIIKRNLFKIRKICSDCNDKMKINFFPYVIFQGRALKGVPFLACNCGKIKEIPLVMFVLQNVIKESKLRRKVHIDFSITKEETATVIIL
jgi:hypothetical protein